MISANVIADSVNPQGNRLTTFELRYPKFIHGEFMTHRVFSRNASSSRAIPTERLLAEVRSDIERAGPVFWGKNQKGMQAAEELTGDDLKHVKDYWNVAAQSAAFTAEQMLLAGCHKQIVNRVLEPFIHINVVCTATEYDNFFGLRLHTDAQPEARALAVAMWNARKASTPHQLNHGDWHLPYVSSENSANGSFWSERTDDIKTMVRVSVARCARVSYRSFETGVESDIKEDLHLYERLVGAQPLHASPAEHQATPDVQLGLNGMYEWQHKDEWGNFIGWQQYRKMLPNEDCAPLPEGY